MRDSWEKKLNKWRFNIRSKFRAAGPPYYRNLQVFHVTAVSTEITCKRSIKTITRNHYRSPVLATAVTPGKLTPEKLDTLQHKRHVVFIFELLSLAESSKKTVICHRHLLHKKTLGPSARRAAQFSTFHMKQLEYFENAQRIIFKTSKNFSREIFQREVDSLIEITSKMVRHLMHKSSTISSSLLY